MVKKDKDLQVLLAPRPLTETECEYYGLELGATLVVRDPETKRILPPSGAHKYYWGSGSARYWRQMVTRGDVVIVQSPPAAVRRTGKNSKED